MFLGQYEVAEFDESDFENCKTILQAADSIEVPFTT